MRWDSNPSPSSLVHSIKATSIRVLTEPHTYMVPAAGNAPASRVLMRDGGSLDQTGMLRHDPTELRRLGAPLGGFYIHCNIGVTDGYRSRLDGFTDHRPFLLTPATINLLPRPGCTRNGGLGFSVLGLFVFLDHAGHWPFPTFVISVVILRNLVG